MSKKSIFLVLALILLLLAACGTNNDAADVNNNAAADNTANDDDTADVELPADTTINCGDVAVGELPDLEGREVVMAVENAYPPFNYLNDAGEGIGWDYDMGRALCDLLNCTPVFQEAAWDGIFPAMAAGEYDVLFDGVTYLDDRAETVAFSCAYVIIGQVLLVRADEARVSTPEEFQADESLLATTQISTTNEIVAHEFLGVDRTQSFEDFGLAVQAVLSGDADAVVIDTVTALGFIGENEGQLRILGGVTSDEQLALVFTPGSDLIEPFTNALHFMANDGSLQAMNDLWFNP